MDATPAAFGRGRLFLADTRLACMLLNRGRYWALHRVFGTSREQANALSVVLLLGAADGAFAAARRVHVPHPSRGMGGMGVLGVQAGLTGIAGPGRNEPGVAGLIGFALIAGAAAPGIKRVMHRVREADRRVREARIARYRAATDALGRVVPASARSDQERAAVGEVRAAQATARDSSAFTNASLPST